MRPEWLQAAHQMSPLLPLLAMDDVYDICINRPGVAWVDRRHGWQPFPVPEMTFERLGHLARAVASATSQMLSAERPLLSATLPGGERVQFVMPPAVAAGCVAMTVRKPGGTMLSLGELARGGLFGSVVTDGRTDPAVAGLQDLLKRRDIAGFLAAAVQSRKNIIISGATGSGKTTLSKALIGTISNDERIITIEDTPELDVQQPNAVSLRYSKDGQGVAKTTPTELIAACLRMKPDRILMQEIRDGTAFDYIRNVNAGHPGSITTVHADSCALAFEQLILLVKQSPAGGSLARDEIYRLLMGAIDVVVQCKRARGEFRVSEIDLVAGRRPA